MRRMHQAVNQPFKEDRIFFPLKQHIKAIQLPAGSLTPYNALIRANQAQWLAVRAILHLPEGAHPFVIFGPYVDMLSA